MANKLRIKRRAEGGAAGAPASLENAELAFNEVDETLYYGKGTGGPGGTATSIIPIGGSGAFLNKTLPAAISAIYSFSVSPTVPTASFGDNSTKAASTAFVAAAISAASIPDGNKGDITVGTNGTVWSINAKVVTNAALADMPSNTLKGNVSASAGAPADLTGAQVKSILALSKADVGLANVDNTSDANKPVSTAQQTALNLKANLASPALSGVPTAPTAAAGTNTTQIASTQFVVNEIASRLASTDALLYKGAIDASTNPNYPAADAGHTYRISVAGKIGGASGKNVEVGDLLICNVDGTAAGTDSVVGTKWDIIQTNIDGALTTSHIGSLVQGFDSTLAGLASLAPSSNQGIYASGTDLFSTYSLTAGGRALGGVAGTANAIPYFSAANVVSELTTTVGGRALLAAAGTANTFPYFSAANVVSLGSITAFGRSLIDDADSSTARTTLGLGSMATQAATNVNITGGSITGATVDNIVLDGGTF